MMGTPSNAEPILRPVNRKPARKTTVLRDGGRTDIDAAGTRRYPCRRVEPPPGLDGCWELLMLHAFPDPRRGADGALPTHEVLRACGWIDLFEPTPEEISAVEAATGLHVPTRPEISEIEASSRLRRAGDTLCMTAPLIASTGGDDWCVAPTGFVLTHDLCLTVRFNHLNAFDEVARDLETAEAVPAAEAFTRLLEEVVDRAADHLEATAAQLNQASRSIFNADPSNSIHLSRDTRRLRQLIIDVGRASERMSDARYALISIARMVQFASDRGRDWLTPQIQDRLAAVRGDAASLEQFEDSLLSRVQLLQDAATGFIGIEQNEVVKVLTIASVVGIPPVLVVGVYGMNFKYMPELTWSYGYPYALALIVISAVVPLVWFKWKDWM